MYSLILAIIILLVGTAFLGDILNIREFKLPKANTGVKITAILISLILWFGSAFQQPRKANFRVTNNLTPNVLSERVVLTIDGEEIGSITSSNVAPKSTEEFTVPKAGIYNYSVELSGIYNSNGKEVSFHGQGGGTINIDSGDTFEVEGDFNNDRITVTLVEK
jgi:hypothetical protein